MRKINKAILVIFMVSIQLTNIHLESAQAGILTITVRKGMSVIPNYRLTIESDRGNQRTVTSGRDGRIEVNLAPGTYVIRMRNNEDMIRVHISSEPKNIDVTVRN